MTRSRADVLVAGSTCGALPATNPWIDRDVRACFCVSSWPHAFDYAGDFVSECERKCAARAHVEFLAVTEYEVAILHVKVGMADTTAFNPHQHLAALRPWGVYNGFA
jgi:hypothetical protein